MYQLQLTNATSRNSSSQTQTYQVNMYIFQNWRVEVIIGFGSRLLRSELQIPDRAAFVLQAHAAPSRECNRYLQSGLQSWFTRFLELFEFLSVSSIAYAGVLYKPVIPSILVLLYTHTMIGLLIMSNKNTHKNITSIICILPGPS